MKWTTKSKIQNCIAKFPTSFANQMYYQVLKQTGGIVNLKPNQRIDAAIAIALSAVEQNIPLNSARVMEIGTGYRVSLPLGLWLCGAKELVTVDLNPYLKMELVRNDLTYIQNNPEEIESLFTAKSHSILNKDRFKKILTMQANIRKRFCQKKESHHSVGFLFFLYSITARRLSFFKGE